MNKPYIFHDPHSSRMEERAWGKELVIVAIDPGKSMGFRKERRSPDAIETLDYRLIVTSDDVVDGVSTFYSDVSNSIISGDLDDIHVVVIEKQLPTNTKMQRLEAHIISTFQAHLRDKKLLPLILAADAKQKYRQLGAPPGRNKNKDWNVAKAIEILRQRGDQVSIDRIQQQRGKGGKKARSDLADVVLEIEALCSYHGWPTTDKVYKR